MRGFVRWYDAIYAHKNYQQEATTAINFVREFSQTCEHILEIGAGTGNHTLQFAPFAKRLTAVEIDPEMASLGRHKTAHLPQIHWHVGGIETAPDHLAADTVFALFNVINYLVDETALRSFFTH